ncbi:hypothetical protein QWY31_09085 [Cytophagales bacterium LB-30]|uniref:Tetratricopeptide repeat protein n=1 Tax=Shiella aurantiaca TaxID=3058365 RepID=A0ABT8F5C3_9BACT|nr:hypothetical protein [Shiella aurantiaca]MDN4165655.1 hypothetical protein [Shiella aurantiaca]
MKNDYFKILFEEHKENNLPDLNYSTIIDEMIDSGQFSGINNAYRYYQSKNFELALQEIEKAIITNARNPFLFQFRANIKEEQSDFQSAIIDYKNALRIGQDWYSIYNQIAICFTYLKNFSQALKAYDIAIQLKNNLINENIDESNMSYLNNGVVMRVDFERIYANRANVKLSLGDYEGCLDDIKISVHYNENYSTPYFIAGLLFEKVNQKKECFEALNRAKELGHPQAERAIKHFFG